MALPSADNPANYGARLVRAIKKRYYMACYNKITHQHSLTAIEHGVAISRKKPGVNYTIYVCEFCTCLHVGRSRIMLPEEFDVC